MQKIVFNSFKIIIREQNILSYSLYKTFWLLKNIGYKNSNISWD